MSGPGSSCCRRSPRPGARPSQDGRRWRPGTAASTRRPSSWCGRASSGPGQSRPTEPRPTSRRPPARRRRTPPGSTLSRRTTGPWPISSGGCSPTRHSPASWRRSSAGSNPRGRQPPWHRSWCNSPCPGSPTSTRAPSCGISHWSTRTTAARSTMPLAQPNSTRRRIPSSAWCWPPCACVASIPAGSARTRPTPGSTPGLRRWRSAGPAGW